MTYKDSLANFLILLESKDHLIDKLDLSDEQKSELKDFFNKHPNYENKIDWNKKNLGWDDFEPLFDLEGKSKTQAKKKGIEGLTEDVDYKILVQNENYIIYYPLTHLGSKILASSKVFSDQVGRWCISMNKSGYWDKYVKNGTDFFFVFISKKENGQEMNEKFAISRNKDAGDPEEEVWNFAHGISASDDIDENDYPVCNYNFFDAEDQQYEDWSECPWFKEICQVLKQTPNYIYKNIYKEEEQPGAKIEYCFSTIVSRIALTPEVFGKTVRIKYGTTTIGDAGCSVFSNPKNQIYGNKAHDPYKIEFPDTLTRINNYAFGYSGITELILPGSVEYLGARIFGILLTGREKNPVITFKEMPDQLYLTRDAIAGCNSQEITVPGILKWPGPIAEFIKRTQKGESWLMANLDDGVLKFSMFGLLGVRATDGTYSSYKVAPSSREVAEAIGLYNRG